MVKTVITLKKGKMNKFPQSKQEAIIQERVGDKIRELRIVKKMTLKSLSSQVGISPGQLSKIETGKATISIKILTQICQILKRPLSYLFQREDEIPRVLGTLNTVAGPENHGILWFAQEIQRCTDQRISLIPLSTTQLGSARDQVKQLCQGVIDLFIDELYQYQQFVSALNIFSLPYTFQDVNQQQIFLRSSYFRNKVLNTLLVKGIQFLNSRWNWFRGLEWVLVSTRPIFKPDEIKGLRVRIYESETLSRFWEHMGANPVVVPWPKVKESLQKEEVDVVATRKSHVYPLEFCRYARYVTLLGDVSPVLGVGMNEVKYQTLPPSIQNSLKDACDAAGDSFTEHIRRSEKKNELLNISRFKAAYLKVDDTPWRQAVSRARNKLIEEDLVSREIWEEINRCRHKRGDL